MALHAASYASSAVAPTVSGMHGYGTLALSEDALPDASHPTLARDPAMCSGLPLAYANPIQSFPMVSPALSVMVPASAAGQILHKSPIASQVCVSQMRAVHSPQWCQTHDPAVLALAGRCASNAADARYSFSASCTDKSCACSSKSCCEPAWGKALHHDLMRRS